MKKAILITVGAIAGTTSIISAGVFLPSLYLNSSPSTVKVDSNQTFISNKAQSSVTLKDAVMGTTKVNKGNYVLYFGSEGIDSNFKFLYKVSGTGTSVEHEKEKQLEKRSTALSGDYWSAINYVTNNVKADEDLVKPEFIAYVNLLGKGVLDGRQRVADETTDCLRDVINAKDSYSSLKEEEKTKIKDKYNWIRDILTAGSPILRFMGKSVLEFYKILDWNFIDFAVASGLISQPESNNPVIPEAIRSLLKKEPTKDDTVYQAVNWKVLISSIQLKTNPFDTYQTWDKRTEYYDQSSYTQEFRDLWDFIKSNPLFTKRPPKDINGTKGFILGYRDGKLTEFFEDSFDAEKPEEKPEEGGGEGSEGGDNGETTPENPEAPKLYVEANKKDPAPLPPSTNSFYTWISKQYAKKSDNNNNENNNDNNNSGENGDKQ